jgi:hypothetical protein
MSFIPLQIDITKLPYIASEMLGISEYAGGVLCTMILFLAMGLPTILLIEGKSGMGGVLIEGLLVVIFGVAVGWVDFWIILFIGFVVAMMLAYKFAIIGDN